MNKLLEIHTAEYEAHEIGKELGLTGGLRLRANKAAILFKLVAEMIIMLTTYLDKFGVDENGRRELFEDVQVKERFHGG